MGVEAKTIVMVGINIPSSVRMLIDNDEFYDMLDEYSSYEHDISYINDGMCGEYLYVGKVLAYSEDMYDTFNVELEFSNAYINMISSEVENHVYEKLGVSEDAKLIVFNHIY